MKIVIIGYSGSGKSTLAKILGRAYNTEVLHLDSVHWLPGWKKRNDEDKSQITDDFLNSHSSWVIDGNYSNLFYDRRMEEADMIIFLNFNRFSCLLRAFRRYFKYRGSTRDDIGKGCPEKMDFEFIRWILHDGRSKRAKARYAGVIRKYSQKTVIIRNQRELDEYKSQISKGVNENG